jgi:hypothetical protein
MMDGVALRLLLLISVLAVVLLTSGCGSSPPAAAGSSANDPLNTTITTAANSSAAQPRTKLRPGAKTKALPAAGDRSYDKTFDDLRFDMTVGAPFHRSMLTKQIEALNGQKIRIRGYILPTPQRRGVRQFVLVRDNQECCFGPGAALYDCILVEMQPGKTAEYSIRPVAAEGVFKIQEIAIGGKHLAVYHMDAELVGPS